MVRMEAQSHNHEVGWLPGRALVPYAFPERLAAFPWVRRLVLFGSRARGDHRARSDFDIAVDCAGAGVMQWQELLDVAETADTLHRIDLVRLDTLRADDPLRHAIERDGVVIFERR
jgi:predicted nucleotidyltransferase